MVRLFCRLALCLVLLSALAPAGLLATPATSIAIVEGNTLNRIPVNTADVKLLARIENVALVCVEIGGVRRLAKTEGWMTGTSSSSDIRTYHTGTVSGGANGIGDIRSVPTWPVAKCV
ncbi:hypothetical protein [Novosphingobium soli]|uniref:SH3 domain-containing protein n=1 Tax=Novosphingobium soli TaxID=574956 RepID=A0ABV6CRU0_9SPHN